MRSLREVLDATGTSPEAGLSTDAVARSRARFGQNHLTPLPREPLWRKFLEKFDEPIIKILLAAALLSIVVELFDKASKVLGGVALVIVVAVIGASAATPRLRRWVPTLMFGLALLWVAVSAATGHPAVEGFAVMVAVVLATGVAFASEYKSDREFEVLNTRKDEILVKVTRDGGFTTVPLEKVVVGDLITLETGDEIPADGRLVRATDLMLNQSLMTGESLAVPKMPRPVDDTDEGPESPGCLYRG